MLEVIIWLVFAFIMWNLLSISFFYSRRWVDRNKQDIVKCKWGKDD